MINSNSYECVHLHLWGLNGNISTLMSLLVRSSLLSYSIVVSCCCFYRRVRWRNCLALIRLDPRLQVQYLLTLVRTLRITHWRIKSTCLRSINGWRTRLAIIGSIIEQCPPTFGRRITLLSSNQVTGLLRFSVYGLMLVLWRFVKLLCRKSTFLCW